jgi:molybdate transport system substrate-binding protein
LGAGLELLSTLGLQGALRELIPAFEGQTGIRLNSAFGPTAVQMERIAGGAMADVAILTAEGIDALIAAGTLLAGSRTDLARSAVGIAVRAGAARPDISSVPAQPSSRAASPPNASRAARRRSPCSRSAS